LLNKNKKFLIVCWSFPPNPGIGGRRWAKFVKYLIKDGYEVFIIKEKIESSISDNQWLDGLNIPKENIFELKRHFLSNSINTSKGFIGKIKNRISLFLLKIIESGTIYDATVGLKKEFSELLKRLILVHEIDKIVVTGAPFNLFYYTALTIRDNENIISVADYRDPWIEAENYGMKSLNYNRKLNEINKQNLVFETFSFVTAPTKSIFESMIKQYNGQKGIKSKFVELKHAFDKDDLMLKSNSENRDTSIIKFTYGGTIYLESEQYLHRLSEFISKFNKINPIKQIEAVFYTPEYLKFKDSFSDLIFKQPIGNNIFSVLNNSDYVILLSANHNKDFKTTKFYEYMCLNKPFFYLGPKGDVANTIEDNRMGIVFNDLNDSEIQQEILKSHPIDNNILISQNDYQYRTKQLIQLLES
jgi:hypothetical protein